MINKLFFMLWLILGLVSMTMGWSHILTWVIGTFFWITFVEEEKVNKNG